MLAAIFATLALVAVVNAQNPKKENFEDGPTLAGPHDVPTPDC